MKDYLTKLTLLFLPIIIFGIALEVLLRQVPNDYTLKKKYLDENASKIETLILGNSHAFYAIRPSYFKVNTFNAALRSQSLDYDYEIYKKYKDNFTNLKTIILPISYPSLWGRLSAKQGASFIINNYKMYYGFGSSDLVPFHMEIFNRPLEVNIRRINQFFIDGRSPQFSERLGWGKKSFKKIKYTLIESGEIGAKQHTFDDINLPRLEEAYNDNIAMLKNMIQWCKSNNIEVILFTAPAHESYRKNLNSQQLNKMFETVNMLASEHENCRYFNFLNDPRFIPEDYRDAHHLSIKGANKFTKIVGNELGYLKEEYQN